MGVQTICLVPQEIFWGPEKILSHKKHGLKINLDKKAYKKDLGSNKFFSSNKAHIGLTTTLSLIEV